MTMYFATDESIWRFKPDSTTSISTIILLASEYHLNQNYPNPFNPSTKISYTLKEEGNVKLLIYDIKGELISTLVNERQQSGSYEVDFTLPGSISTGVYIYRLTVSDNSHNMIFSDVKKMIYLKHGSKKRNRNCRIADQQQNHLLFSLLFKFKLLPLNIK
jgi:hypothetical protein